MSGVDTRAYASVWPVVSGSHSCVLHGMGSSGQSRKQPSTTLGYHCLPLRDGRLLLASLGTFLRLGLCIGFLSCRVLPGGDGHLRKSGKLHSSCVHEGDDIGSDVRGGSSKKALFRNYRHPWLVLLPRSDLHHHVLAHDFSDSSLLNDKLALQKGMPLPQLQLVLLFRAFLQLFLIGGKASLQYVLHLGQMSIGLPGSLRIGENLLHIYTDKLRVLIQAARQCGECQEHKKEKTKAERTVQCIL